MGTVSVDGDTAGDADATGGVVELAGRFMMELAGSFTVTAEGRFKTAMDLVRFLTPRGNRG